MRDPAFVKDRNGMVTIDLGEGAYDCARDYVLVTMELLMGMIDEHNHLRKALATAEAATRAVPAPDHETWNDLPTFQL